MSYHCIKNSRECDGCMECHGKSYYCPVCGEAVYENLYVSIDGAIIGCDNCVEKKDVWEVMEEDYD